MTRKYQIGDIVALNKIGLAGSWKVIHYLKRADQSCAEHMRGRYCVMNLHSGRCEYVKATQMGNVIAPAASTDDYLGADHD
jgi:hypothetical protein